MLINKAAVRKFVLEYSKSNRNGKFKRVSREFYERADLELSWWLEKYISSHPSVGKTIM